MGAAKLFKVSVLISLTAFYAAGCVGGGRVNPAGYAFPDSVLADRISFGVTRGPIPQSFMLNMKFSLSAAGEEQKPETPPTDEQWRKAAEQALPAGCKIDEIKPSEGGEAQVKFSC